MSESPEKDKRQEKPADSPKKESVLKVSSLYEQRQVLNDAIALGGLRKRKSPAEQIIGFDPKVKPKEPSLEEEAEYILGNVYEQKVRKTPRMKELEKKRFGNSNGGIASPEGAESDEKAEDSESK